MPSYTHYGTFTVSKPITNPELDKLCLRVGRCIGSEDYIAVIRKIARTRDPQAIDVLIALLDSPGIVGRAAARALTRFGCDALPAARRLIRRSLDSDAIRNAQMVVSRVKCRCKVGHVA